MEKMNMENTVAELRSEITIRKLNDKMEEYAIEINKNVTKLNKKDLLTVLGDIEVVDPKPEAEDEAETIPELTADEKNAETALHNKTQVMCIVTDHYTGAQLEEEVNGRVFSFSLGNKLGSVEARVNLNGEPQYLHVGTIRKLRKFKLTKMGYNREDIGEGNNRFTVVIVDGWDEKKLQQKKKEQAIKSA